MHEITRNNIQRFVNSEGWVHFVKCLGMLSPEEYTKRYIELVRVVTPRPANVQLDAIERLSDDQLAHLRDEIIAKLNTKNQAITKQVPDSWIKDLGLLNE